jgi:hypothetical protein
VVNFDALFEALDKEISDLKVRFLSSFLPAKPEHTPLDFEYDVKSFLLLSHAAFEEFVEAISEAMMNQIEADLLLRKSTIATACFLSAYGIRLTISEDEDGGDKSCFDHIREAVSQAKKLHSITLKDNHGFSVKYMRKLLVPVGIDVPRGPELESLKKLAEARGSFAHTMAKLARYGAYKRANRVLTPEEAAEAAEDCRKLCDAMRARAQAVS